MSNLDNHFHKLSLEHPEYIVIWALSNHAKQLSDKDGKYVYIADSEAFIEDLASKLTELYEKETD